MGQITDIKVAKSKKARRNLYIDNEFICSLDELTLSMHDLRIGQELQISELERIAMESEVNSAFSVALTFITRAPKTKKQVLGHLSTKGYLENVCQEVITKLEDYRLVDDESFAADFVDTYSAKYGKTKLYHLLLVKGVDTKVIENALKNLSEQPALIREFAQKYMKNKEPNSQNWAKLCRYLVTKGFEWQEIEPVICEMRRCQDADRY